MDDEETSAEEILNQLSNFHADLMLCPRPARSAKARAKRANIERKIREIVGKHRETLLTELLSEVMFLHQHDDDFGKALRELVIHHPMRMLIANTLIKSLS